MRSKVFVGSSMFLVVLLFSSVAGGDSDKPWGNTVEGCRIRVTAGRNEYKVGDPIDLSITLQNRDRKELDDVSDPIYEIKVILHGHGEALLTRWGKREMYSMRHYSIQNASVKLSTGQSSTYKFSTLNRAFDMTLSGKYDVEVQRRVSSELDPKAYVDVFSNVLTLNVVERPQ